MWKNTKLFSYIEKKFQNANGSVDEKLQTFGFKLWQYSKLFNPLNIKVKYFYVLSDWFKQNKYADTLEYMKKIIVIIFLMKSLQIFLDYLIKIIPRI